MFQRQNLAILILYLDSELYTETFRLLPNICIFLPVLSAIPQQSTRYRAVMFVNSHQSGLPEGVPESMTEISNCIGQKPRAKAGLGPPLNRSLTSGFAALTSFGHSAQGLRGTRDITFSLFAPGDFPTTSSSSCCDDDDRVHPNQGTGPPLGFSVGLWAKPMKTLQANAPYISGLSQKVTLLI
jgi:hypothetical protein